MQAAAAAAAAAAAGKKPPPPPPPPPPQPPQVNEKQLNLCQQRLAPLTIKLMFCIIFKRVVAKQLQGFKVTGLTKNIFKILISNLKIFQLMPAKIGPTDNQADVSCHSLKE